jgi:transcriptional regulator with XRE-family HTH domain
VAHDPSAPPARLHFANQLRRLRALKGFASAREFAHAVGIDENRYTRYERAEVEPSLTVLLKMCETLGVSPNELLGF